MNQLCFFVSCVPMLSGLFIAALWSPYGTSLLLVMLIVFFVTFPCGILGQV